MVVLGIRSCNHRRSVRLVRRRVEDPQDWHFPYFNDETGAAVDRQLAAADTLSLGRKTSERVCTHEVDTHARVCAVLAAGVPSVYKSPVDSDAGP
jgi:hypothetical protein